MGWKIGDKITVDPGDNDLVPLQQGDNTRNSTLARIKKFFLGDEKLKTTAQTITGAINENTAQMSEKANLTSIAKAFNLKLRDCVGVFTYQDKNNAVFAQVASVGIKYVRMDINWEIVETTKGVYDFSVYDGYINYYINNCITPQFTLLFGNKLYNGLGVTQRSILNDTELEAFNNFVSACVARYKDKNIIWEIWNEPNLEQFWTPQNANTPYYFTKVVKRVYNTIKSIDKTGVVIAPSMATSNGNEDYLNFFEKCCKEGILEYTDIVALHPYNSVAPESRQNVYNMYREIVNKYTDRNIPFYCNEVGYSNTLSSTWDGTSNSAIVETEEIQAKYYMRLFFLNISNGVRTNFANVADIDNLATGNSEAKFGIFHSYTQGYTYKQSATAIKNMIDTIGDYYFVARLDSPSDDYILKFMDNEKNVYYVYWTVDSDHTTSIQNTLITMTDTVQYLESNKDFEQNLNSEIRLKNIENFSKNKINGIERKVKSIMGNNIINLVENGNFNAGLNNWSTSTSNPTSVSINNNELTFTPSSQYSGYISKAFNVIAGHKYYFACKMKTNANNCFLAFVSSDGNTSTKYYYGNGDYQILSSVVTINTTSTARIKPQSDATSGWSAVSVKNFIVIDLTLTFGAGNEPESSNMDKMLEYYPENLKNYIQNSASLNSSGWFKDKDTGIIIQWGTVLNTDTSSGTVTLPLSFPTSILSISTAINRGDSTTFPNVNTNAWSASSFSWYASVSLTTGVGFRWIAIGY